MSHTSAGAKARPRRRAAVFAAACLVASLFVGRPAAADTVPASAELPMFTDRPDHKPTLVRISVGNGTPVPVNFDTGSSGLYVMAADIGPDVQQTSTPIHQGYVDGTRFEGYVGLATVRLVEAGVETAQPISIGVITRVSCADDKPNCPASDQRPGVMGVSLQASGALISPLAQLPGNLNSGFIVDMLTGEPPHVTIGLTSDSLKGFRFASLQPAAQSSPDIASWDAGSITGCYAVDEAAASCQKLIFDTGAVDGVFDGGALTNLRVGPHGFLLPGQTLSLQIPDALDLSLLTDRSTYIMPKATPHSNLGQALFHAVAVAFDGAHGRIGFRAP
ncbi:hypothetical protein SAMN02745157_2748 [Kaistia soli DSM 19436]|uniref:PE cleavage protein A C-terminal domain-containing protein n=1 Tax=Kaistia soli DSM 19436 TaxID=1122133 RepID=A0A1M5DNN1_9HYPH|nr:hypothetical protein [Kaistia soli]SHF68609.1 hypothetical protein SAMN02745157_2748 [Kaistia soli DSM 19436]